MIKIFLAMMMIQFGALILPGPDFAIVFRTSVIKGKRAGFFCACGITVAVMINTLITYFIGSTLYFKYHLLYLSFIGCGLLYLFYISFSLIHNFWLLHKQEVQDISTISSNINHNSFMSGLLTNLSNMKAIVFFSALLPFANALNTPFKILAWLGMAFSALVWFSFVTIMFGNKKVRLAFMAKIHIFELIIGIVIFFFASAIFYQAIYKYFIH